MNKIPAELYRLFPALQFDEIAQYLAPYSEKYNCIMHTIGGRMLYIWPTKERPLSKSGDVITFWPTELSDDNTLDNFLEMYRMFKYEPCDDDSYDKKYRKIAIYCKKGTNAVTHAALQHGPDIWSSKLGDAIAIYHRLRSLEGNIYGEVRQFVQRPRTITKDVDWAVLSSYIENA